MVLQDLVVLQVQQVQQELPVLQMVVDLLVLQVLVDQLELQEPQVIQVQVL